MGQVEATPSLHCLGRDMAVPGHLSCGERLAFPAGLLWLPEGRGLEVPAGANLGRAGAKLSSGSGALG